MGLPELQAIQGPDVPPQLPDPREGAGRFSSPAPPFHHPPSGVVLPLGHQLRQAGASCQEGQTDLAPSAALSGPQAAIKVCALSRLPTPLPDPRVQK